MARMARVVIPNYPHHITQRGNRRQETFFIGDDYQAYISLLSNAKKQAGIDVWAYCLMPNHVHLVVVPEHEDSLAVFFRAAHRQYTRRINVREGWRGHLWQERFHSFVMDETYLLAAVRYVELNPVKAQLCQTPEDWAWSSTQAHLRGKDDALVSVSPMLDRISDWREYLGADENIDMQERIREYTRTGRPGGTDDFLKKLEQQTSRILHKGKPGPKSRGIK
ncbi:transposase [Neptunomonas sp.]|uniref:transposase n=1 Tax=Neptunomonas sp. TaxID=1971898 RepID=UPI003564AD53